jgi:RNA polymerase sigma-70 factor, ECF subfamily
MGVLMESNLADSADLIARARAGDRDALNSLLEKYRDRLRRMVEMRLDTRLHARLDASDVVQEAYVEVAERLGEYLREPKLPLFLWLRLVVGERLVKLHRHHLGTRMRDAGREVSLYQGALPAASSAALAAHLLGRHTSPTQAAVRAERILRLQEALNAGETARVLGIEESAAAKRYFRALKRLKDVLSSMPGGQEGV